MFDRFRSHLEQSDLIPQGSRVLVGYSGGPDSTCLLHLLHRCGVEIVGGYLHHSQRDEADKELKLCEAFCTDLGVPFLSGKANVPRMATDLKIGLEEAGRRARYAFFEQASKQVDCSLVATAHNRTDHVETVLLNLTRGSGLAGLAGIPDQRGNIIRPLLPFSREEIREYCKEQGLWTAEDPSNTDISFARARMRLRVLPELSAINAGVEGTISRLSEIAEEEDTFLDSMAAAALEQCESELNGDLRFLTMDCEVALNRAKISQYPPVLFKRAMRLIAEVLGSSLNFEQTVALLHGVQVDEKGSITTEGGEVAFDWSSDLIHARQLQPVVPFRYPVTMPGETVSEEFGWTITCQEEISPEMNQTRASMSVLIDSLQMKGALHFRSAQSGDEMIPFGFDRARKLADILSEAKLTQAARQRLPIICDMIGPLWAPGVCLSERARLTANSQRAVRIKFEPSQA
ncbi:MAG: tRNA lysidine(34) synthetase TilS [Fimbriimonadaceae bacterium]|nr:tRNA lysidine(34) synthetase TilS [Fimbriimonadaceae bacterium]